MSADRELLELAAKAAGDVVVRGRFGGEECWLTQKMGGLFPYNPLTDDGDCARLEVACGLHVKIGAAIVEVSGMDMIRVLVDFRHTGHDLNAARRLASCRAAAEIGRAM